MDRATPPISWRTRLRPLLMPAVYTLLVLIVHWRMWTPIKDARATYKYDPQHAYWGDLAYSQHALGDGDVPVWNPYDRAGFPIYGDPQPGTLYPPNWPLWAVGAITGNSSRAKKYAGAGAATGALVGGSRKRDTQRRQREWEQQQQQQYAQRRNNYNRAYAACMEGRDYTVR